MASVLMHTQYHVCMAVPVLLQSSSFLAQTSGCGHNWEVEIFCCVAVANFSGKFWDTWPAFPGQISGLLFRFLRSGFFGRSDFSRRPSFFSFPLGGYTWNGVLYTECSIFLAGINNYVLRKMLFLYSVWLFCAWFEINDCLRQPFLMHQTGIRFRSGGQPSAEHTL